MIRTVQAKRLAHGDEFLTGDGRSTGEYVRRTWMDYGTLWVETWVVEEGLDEWDIPPGTRFRIDDHAED